MTVQELINKTRRMVQDWPDIDVLTASLSSNATLVSVGDGTQYYKNFHVEVDNELMTVATTGTGTTFPVRRGTRGTTAATHVTGSTVLIRPGFPAVQILDALNHALQEAYPLIYKPVLDTSLTTLASTYEYTVPLTIKSISKVEMKLSGNTDYSEVRGWSVRRGASSKLQFVNLPEPGATIRVHGFGPFDDMTLSGSTDVQWPDQATVLLPVGAAAYLLMSGEAGRVSTDTLPTDSREAANRPGSSMSIGNALYGRFRSMLLNAAMPPLPKHAKPTF